jgi:predicted unusual protein kinase regulating ubiquinone biosynthesis (AarF/ABC1/UbiB family)
MELAVRELDFTHEAANMTRVRAALARHRIDVTVPAVVPHLVTRRVIVMAFCPGFKITDAAALDKHGVDRVALLQKISQAFAIQMFEDGLFNADPHPGNILVHVSGGVATPVLLDFGLCKDVRPTVRIALARMVHAADIMDFGGLLVRCDLINPENI